MGLLEAIILGLTQGLTEFIPVSSSGHLEIVEQLLGGNAENFHLFLELINIGTLLALLIYFRKRILGILNDIFKKHNYKLALNIIITSIPAGIIGFLLSDFIEETPFFGAMVTVAIAMGLVGLLMIFADKLPHLSKLKNENYLTKTRALLIGLAQTFALIPGVSRSGSTIVAGRMVGMNSESSAEYSFLASIPIMCGVCLKTFISSSSREYFAANAGSLILSNAVAFIAGLFAIDFVMRFLKKPGTLKYFGYYRVILACLVLAIELIK